MTKWVKHMMMYDDGWFSWDQMFPFYAFNCLMRHKNKFTSNFFVKDHLKYTVSTVSKLRDQIANGNYSTLSHVIYMCKNITGSNSYYREKRMSCTHGSNTILTVAMVLPTSSSPCLVLNTTGQTSSVW